MNAYRAKLPSQEHVLEFDERTMRELISSPYGGAFGHRLLAYASSGGMICIRMSSGGVRTLKDATDALQTLLEHFNWKAQIDSSHGRAEGHLLDVCRRMSRIVRQFDDILLPDRTFSATLQNG